MIAIPALRTDWETDSDETCGIATQTSPVEAAEVRLRADSHRWLRCVRCDFDETEGVLTVTGRVPSFYLKQLVTSLVKDIDGVARIENRVAVLDAV